MLGVPLHVCDPKRSEVIDLNRCRIVLHSSVFLILPTVAVTFGCNRGDGGPTVSAALLPYYESMAVGDSEYQSGDFDAAVDAYEKALEAFPNRADAQYKIAASQAARGETEAARVGYEKAVALYHAELERYPGRPDAEYKLGVCFAALDQTNKAIEKFTNAIELGERSGDAYRGRGALFLATDQPGVAIGDYSVAISIDPQSHDFVQRARAHIALGDVENAAYDCRRAIRLDPTNRDAHLTLAVTLSVNPQSVEAEGALAQWRTLSADDPDVSVGSLYYLLAAHLTQVGRGSPAATTLAKVTLPGSVSEAPPTDQATALERLEHGVERFRRGNWRAAMKQYAETMQIDPAAPERYYRTYVAKPSLDATDLDATPPQLPTDAPSDQASTIDGAAALKRARQAIETKEPIIALEELTNAIQTLPEESALAEAYALRGKLYLEFENPQNAAADFSSAIELQQQAADVYFLRGLAHSGRGARFSAIEDYTQAISLDPMLARAYFERGMEHYRLWDHALAVQNFNAALRPPAVWEPQMLQLAIAQLRRLAEENPELRDELQVVIKKAEAGATDEVDEEI